VAITLTASLLSATDPAPVQIALAGTAAGQSYRVAGNAADGSSWAIPGGAGVSAGTQVLLVDNRLPPNSVVTYTAIVGGVGYAAAPITVAAAAPAYLQTIDGLTIVPVEIASVREPRKASTRSGIFEIAGRRMPAARVDAPGSYEYSWALETESIDSSTMLAILQSGSPVVRRVVTGLRDLAPVVIGVVVDWSDELLTDGYDTWRRWTIRVREIGDPQPSSPLIAYTWDDFDAAMASRTWATFDGLFASWDEFDAADWASLT
jgi:hypothetical protein